MASKVPAPLSGGRPPVFALACWGLGVMAFTQLLIAGLALSTRFEESKVVQIKEVPKIVAVRVPVPAVADAETTADVSEPDGSVVSRPPLRPAPKFQDEAPALPSPTPVSAPVVGDPRSERLVRDARQARVAGDMMKAITKLEEAMIQSPDDPTVHYELGLVHEQMGVYDKASAHYEKVFQMGMAGAGRLYELAADKLSVGFEQPDAMLGKMSLGRISIFKTPESDDGQRAILTIPVQKAPGEEIDPSQVQVEVHFFNRTAKGEVLALQSEEKSWSQDKWISEPCDWGDGDENLRVVYTIPPQDEQTAHLFGQKRYYGQVVILRYGNDVLDLQAFPRDLAARIQQAPPVNNPDPMLPDFQDTLPPDFDPNNPLLLPPK